MHKKNFYRMIKEHPDCTEIIEATFNGKENRIYHAWEHWMSTEIDEDIHLLAAIFAMSEAELLNEIELLNNIIYTMMEPIDE